MTVFLRCPPIDERFALIVHMASRQQMVYSERYGKFLHVPSYQEFSRNRDKYPEFEDTMNETTLKLEVTLKEEAGKNPDQRLMIKMVEDGFFGFTVMDVAF